MDCRVKPGNDAGACCDALLYDVVRLDRATQYAAASQLITRGLWNTGSPAGAGHRAACCTDAVAGDDGCELGDETPYCPINFSHSSSVSTSTPCFLASASFEPAPGPATT